MQIYNLEYDGSQGCHTQYILCYKIVHVYLFVGTVFIIIWTISVYIFLFKHKRQSLIIYVSQCSVISKDSNYFVNMKADMFNKNYLTD